MPRMKSTPAKNVTMDSQQLIHQFCLSWAVTVALKARVTKL